MLYAKRFLETKRKKEHAICSHRHKQKLLRLELDFTDMAPKYSTIRNLFQNFKNLKFESFFVKSKINATVLMQ